VTRSRKRGLYFFEHSEAERRIKLCILGSAEPPCSRISRPCSPLNTFHGLDSYPRRDPILKYSPRNPLFDSDNRVWGDEEHRASHFRGGNVFLESIRKFCQMTPECRRFVFTITHKRTRTPGVDGTLTAIRELLSTSFLSPPNLILEQTGEDRERAMIDWYISCVLALMKSNMRFDRKVWPKHSK